MKNSRVLAPSPPGWLLPPLNSRGDTKGLPDILRRMLTDSFSSFCPGHTMRESCVSLSRRNRWRTASSSTGEGNLLFRRRIRSPWSGVDFLAPPTGLREGRRLRARLGVKGRTRSQKFALPPTPSGAVIWTRSEKENVPNSEEMSPRTVGTGRTDGTSRACTFTKSGARMATCQAKFRTDRTERSPLWIRLGVS